MAGSRLLPPKGDPIIKDGIPFVRFTSDSQEYDDPAVQTLALHRILTADLVYVVAPDGYVGRTTCYEIGRVIQAGHPIYFSAQPSDLPLRVPIEHIKSPRELVDGLRTGDLRLKRLFASIEEDYALSEEDLLEERLRDE